MKKMGLLLLAMLSVSPVTYSQPYLQNRVQPGSGAAAPVTVAPEVRAITLGNSVVPLDGTWKFQPGDSPWVNGAPEWAQPGYDDSKWANMDMTPKAGSVSLNLGTAGYIPGWTRRGYPKLDGYAWYRLRVKVADPGHPLWLKMPDDVDDAYQVFANGKYAGQFGKFSPDHVTIFYSQPISLPLPAPGPDGEMEFAIRLYMNPSSLFGSPDAGGMHGPPMLGLASALEPLHAAGRDRLLHVYFSLFLRGFVCLLAAPLALWAWFYNRREHAWLWLFFALVGLIPDSIETVASALTQTVPISTDILFTTVIIVPLLPPLWAMFWWHWFRLESKRWLARAAWLLWAGLTLSTFLAESPVFGSSFIPQRGLQAFNTAAIVFTVAQGLLLVVILVVGYRRDRTEALLATVPVLLLGTGLVLPSLTGLFDVPSRIYVFGLGLGVAHVAVILMVLAVIVLALRRFVKEQVQDSLARQAVKKDLEQAQQLQQRVLVPEAVASPHFTVESEYRPAQTVGGDFFQTLTKPDGTLLVVIGDVSGKGVSAAMLVAVLVGTVRTRADESFDPASMLAVLNRRLMGRSGGHFATCLAAEIRPEGTMRIANAGHLPPYLNGKEMEVEGSLPLGIAGEAEYPVRVFTLKHGDRLTFVTDGVVEATNEAKELFGFERTREMSAESAAAIAERARSFGQEDDITVVGVAFVGAAAVV